MASKLVQFPGAGCVVEFLQGNAPQIAWVMEEQGGKVRLLLPNRREMPLPGNRLLPWAGPRYDGAKSRDDIISLLQKHKERREQLAAACAPVDLWELAQGELEKASAEWLAELTGDVPDVDAVAACGHALLACKSHFRFQPPDFEIYSADTVEQRRQADELAREREALVGGGAAWLRYLWDARVAHKPAATPDEVERLAPPEPVRSRLARLLRSRILDPESTEDDHLWQQVSKGLPDDPHLPLLLAISWGLVPEHYNYWLERADYDPGDTWAEPFADEMARILAETASQTQQPQSAQTGLSFLSIDSATTRDIDDAFHIEARAAGGWIVNVALACPALTWSFGSPLDKAVARRATSIYLPEGDHHMLPEQLGTDAYSLHAGQKRPVLLLRCEVGEDGAPLDVTPSLAWATLGANLNYHDCEAVLQSFVGAPNDLEHGLEHGLADDLPLSQESEATPPADNLAMPAFNNPALPHAASLIMAWQMSQARLHWRVAQGAVIIERPDSDCYLVGEGAETRVFLKETPPTPHAQLLVSEMMILANAALASWAVSQQIPLLFRTQDVAVPPEFAGVWSSPPDISRVVRALTAASLESSARPHAGMGLSAYSPVTSPLRRYVDFLNEAQVLHYLEHGAVRWTQAELDTMLASLSLCLDAAGQVQRFRPRYWKYLYLQQQARVRGDACTWDAVVAEENDAWVSISLTKEQIMVRGKRQLFGEKVFPGQELKVRLGKVNPLRSELSIMAVQEV